MYAKTHHLPVIFLCKCIITIPSERLGILAASRQKNIPQLFRATPTSDSRSEKQISIPQGGAPYLAKLVYKYYNQGLWGLYLQLMGFINQLITGGAPPCSGSTSPTPWAPEVFGQPGWRRYDRTRFPRMSPEWPAELGIPTDDPAEESSCDLVGGFWPPL